MAYLAQTLKDAGYLQPLAQGFGEFADALQSRKEQNTFNQLMSSAVSGIQNNLQQDSAAHNTFTPGNQSALSQLMPKNFVQAPQNTQSQPEQNIMKGLQGTPQTSPNDIVPAQYSQMNPLQQKQKNMRIIANAVMQSTQYKNLPQEMKDKAIQSLQLMAQGSEAPIPTTETKEVGPNASLVGITTTPGGSTTVSTLIKGNKQPKLTHSFLTTAPTDVPELGIKKGDKVNAARDENDLGGPLVVLGKATGKVESKLGNDGRYHPMDVDTGNDIKTGKPVIAPVKDLTRKPNENPKATPEDKLAAATEQFTLINMELQNPQYKKNNNGDIPDLNGFNQLTQDRIKAQAEMNLNQAIIDGKAIKSGNKNKTIKNKNAQAPDSAIKYLKAHPDAKSDFDAKYGQGMSDKYLGNQ